MGQKVYIIAGPTASGKSGYALELARKMNGVIINGDSLQIYNELPLLTAQPSSETQTMVPHRLYGALSHQEKCTVGKWLEMATREINKAFQNGKIPIVVGGTGLYLKALIDGLIDIPEINQSIKNKVQAEFDSVGREEFYNHLKKIDPDYAVKIGPDNTQRVLRARNVFEATGKPFSVWRQQHNSKQHDFAFYKICLMPPREVLYSRCNQRFLQMIEVGIIDEVKAAQQYYIPQDHTLRKAIGFREIESALQGGITMDEAIKKAQQLTRNYAKRQVTWLRHQMTFDEVLK
jgi:tRNA dimethylallyltransferase